MLPTPLWEVIVPWGSICLPTSQHLLRINSREHRQHQRTPLSGTIGSVRPCSHCSSRLPGTQLPWLCMHHIPAASFFQSF